MNGNQSKLLDGQIDRNSSIELSRIIAALFVITLHIKSNIVVNYEAKASFVVYLTHGYFYQ